MSQALIANPQNLPTKREVARYRKLKTLIGSWWNDRLRVGAALREIRDERLYLHEHPSFEAFCAAEFQIKSSQAYRLIEAAGVKESLAGSPNGGQVTNEGQARALALVPEEDREEVLATAAAAGPVTARSIAAAAVAKKSGPDAKPAEPLDRTDYPIPASIVEDWHRADETSRRLLSEISGIRTELKHALAEEDLIFAEVTNSTLADFDNAYASVKCVRPYAVCTSCQGHHRKRCSLCKGRGFISEFAWRSYVPAEVKKLRRG